MAYGIEYSPDSEDHLRALTARQQAIVLDTVDRQLAYQPAVETRHRKPMRPNPLAPWELRIGDLRVYYDGDRAMKTLEIRDATAPLRDYAEGMGNEAVILTLDGKPVAALLAIDHADWETVALSTNPRFIELIDRSRARHAAEGGIPADTLRLRLGLDPSEADG